ncbi:hypothetical protein C7M84_024360 [Penaeus vannamei]|uniref:Transmembrane protein n=1 Tax=Penaeus vannamei TaxID=6689 RepID=A0A423U1A5_PENVA|nr:hypothetical protein C7M84_024360 [Penaeus vannamei]
MATMQMFGRTGNKKTGIILAVIGGLMFAIGIALVITGAALPCSFDEDDWDYDCNSKLPLFITGGFMLPFALIILGLGLTIICYIRHASLITSVSTRTDMHISHQYGTTTVSAQRTVGNSPYPQQAAVPPYPQQEAAPPYSQQAAVPPYPQQEAAPPYSQQAAVPPYHSSKLHLTHSMIQFHHTTHKRNPVRHTHSRQQLQHIHSRQQLHHTHNKQQLHHTHSRHQFHHTHSRPQVSHTNKAQDQPYPEKSAY